MPLNDDEKPSNYQELLELLKNKAQSPLAAAQRAWGGNDGQKPPTQPVYLEPGSKPNYQQDANTVMTTGGFYHPEQQAPAPTPTPEPAPQQRTPPPAYMLPVRDQNKADLFMRSAKFKK